MRRQTLVLWFGLALLAGFDLVLCRRLGLRLADGWHLAFAAASTAAIALSYHLSGRSPRLARAAYWTLLWLVFVNAGTVLTYLAAVCGGPLRDPVLAAIDWRLGFDWVAWNDFLAPRTALRFLLWLAYLSLFPQILISIFWFAWRPGDTRNYEFLLANILALLVTAALFLLAPALGHPIPGRAHEVAALLALRDGGLRVIDLAHLEGLISFPSYHTVLAVLLVWAHRRSPLLPPAAVLNTLMLLAIPSFGGHYLVDMVAGAGVAGLAIAATAATRRRALAHPATV